METFEAISLKFEVNGKPRDVEFDLKDGCKAGKGSEGLDEDQITKLEEMAREYVESKDFREFAQSFDYLLYMLDEMNKDERQRELDSKIA
jgi:hypothetical protein